MSTPETPRIDQLQIALDRGDLDAVRRILLELDGEEQRLLEQEMGTAAFERARRSAARGRRRGKLGRVLVLPGIMGTELDSVDRKGDVDRIWINFARLIAGRIGDLELTPAGEPKREGFHVRPAGVHRKTYVPLLMELDTRWHVRPFPFDWREDIDKSAARLDAEVKAFGAGEPVHLVAHSMGGLVSRRFAQLFPETWRAMDDASGAGRGGRLIMLGTPNRGSFAIPLTLSGAEKVVQLLAKADVDHSLEELLAIVGTFPGMYQMLPSPLVNLQDDHKKLFDVASWGSLPASKPLLARAEKFLRELHAVIDPDRLLYVAGVNQETPAKIRIDAAGKFSYSQTLDGDGRVPHELGLLEGVTTYWVDEVHGDLAKNGEVLDAITELLQTGKTTVLPTAKPAKPRTRAATRGYRGGKAIAPLPAEVDVILEKAKTRRRAGMPEVSREDAIRLENLALAEYLGSGEDTPAAVRGARGLEAEEAVPAAPGPSAARRRRLTPCRSSPSRSYGETSRRSPATSTPSVTTRASCRSGRSSRWTRPSPESPERRSTTRGASSSRSTRSAEHSTRSSATSRSSPGATRGIPSGSSRSPGWAAPERSTQRVCAGSCTGSSSRSAPFRRPRRCAPC